MVWILVVVAVPPLTVGYHNYYNPKYPSYFSSYFDETKTSRTQLLNTLSILLHAYLALLISVVATMTDMLPMLLSLGLWRAFDSINLGFWDILSWKQLQRKLSYKKRRDSDLDQ